MRAFETIGTNKEKEPLLNRKLQRKWLPAKSVAQKIQNQNQSLARAENTLKLGPKERERAWKLSKKDPKMVRVMKEKIGKIYSVNAKHLPNKMLTLKNTSYNRDLDFVQTTEAGLGTNEPEEMKGFRAIKLEHKSPNRGSVLYVRNEY